MEEEELFHSSETFVRLRIEEIERKKKELLEAAEKIIEEREQS
jgi:hypothetical protein